MGFKQADMFPSKYLSPEDFEEGEQRVVTIKDVETENFDNKRTGKQERKFILELRNEKPLILNKTNAGVIFELLGQDTDDWVAKQITLIVKIVDSFGEEKPAIRVKTVLPETDSRLGQTRSAPAGQTAMPIPPATGERMIESTQKQLILREAIRIYGDANAVATVKEVIGNISSLTYQGAEDWITWLKNQPAYKAPIADPAGYDDSDPFAD